MLPVSNLVNVTVNLSPAAAAGRSFGVLMIAGDSNVINGSERSRTYSGAQGVASDFGINAPEYKAAALYFGQVPQPAQCMIGAWIRTAQAALNEGGILTPAQQAISNFNAISNGGFDISVDGAPQTLTGINFNSTTNLNGVASAVNAVLTGAVCSWNGSQFVIKSNTTGVGAPATGTITFSAHGTAADTVTVNGISIELVASSPSGNEIVIGADQFATAGNLYTFLSTSSNASLTVANYSLNGAVITITYKTVGTAGNSFSLAKSSTAISLSAGDLAGGTVPSSVGFATAGSGTDISSLLQLTAATAIALVPGFAAETPAACAAILANQSSAWYGLMFAASVAPTDQQSLDVSAFIEALELTRIYGVTTQNTQTLSTLVTNDLASLMAAGAYDQSTIQYSSSTPYAVASLFGRAFSVDFTAQNSTITLMYKQEPGVVPEDLDDNEELALQNKRCNVFAGYDNDTAIIQYGTMSGTAFFDEIHGLDWFQNAIQTSCYNVLYTSTTKVPQTDAGVNQLTNACNSTCAAAVNNGLAAPGVWNGPSFGALVTGQYLKNGYYVFVPSVDLQSQSDRDARKAPPIQIALKLAGAIQSVDVLVTVNR